MQEAVWCPDRSTGMLEELEFRQNTLIAVHSWERGESLLNWLLGYLNSISCCWRYLTLNFVIVSDHERKIQSKKWYQLSSLPPPCKSVFKSTLWLAMSHIYISSSKMRKARKSPYTQNRLSLPLLAWPQLTSTFFNASFGYLQNCSKSSLFLDSGMAVIVSNGHRFPPSVWQSVCCLQ